MAEDQAGPGGPDLTQGISLAELPDGAKLTGRVANEPVLLVRRGPDVFAIGAHCTHYSGPLADGLIVDDTVRCPFIAPASTFVRAKLCARRPSVRSIRGRSNSSTAKKSCGKSALGQAQSGPSSRTRRTGS